MKKGFRQPKKLNKAQQAGRSRAADIMDTALDATEGQHKYASTSNSNRAKTFRATYRAHVWGRGKRPPAGQVVRAFEAVKFEYDWRRR